MRKTSQDGSDTTSITSGVENESKKSGGLIKTKRNSIKRKVQGLSRESDDTVIEPLLQKDTDKTDTSNQSAKFDLLSKRKTEAIIEMDNDKQKLLQDGHADTLISMPSTSKLPKSTNGTAALHNHMNVNVFSNHDALKGLITTKSQVLVEIDGSKQAGYNPSPLIFTTAKIHTDGKNRHMEPLQVTPVPILSTIEVSVLKGTSINTSAETSGVVTSNISPMYEKIPKSNTNIQDKGQKIKCSLPGITTTQSSKMVDGKASNTTESQFASAVMPIAKDKTVLNTDSMAIKDYNVSKPTAANLKDNIPTESKHGSTEINKDSKQSKQSISQPMTGTNFNTSSINQPIKNGVRNEIEQTNQNKKINNLNISQRTDLNKNITHIDSQNSTAKDKGVVNTIPTGSKQLQRQKIAIDKDDTTAKAKSDDGASTSKNIMQMKSTGNDGSRLSDKSKIPISTANNIQLTIGTDITKPLEPNIISTTTNKSIASNSVISAKPTTSTGKMLSCIVTTTGTDNRTAASLSSNTQTVTNSTGNKVPVTTSTITSSPSTTVTAKNPSITASTVKISSVTNGTVKAPFTTTSSSKILPITTGITTTPFASTISSQSSAATTYTGNTPSMTTSNVKTSTVISSLTKVPLVTTSTVTSPSITICTAKSQAVATCTANTPSASTSKTSSATTGTAKSLPAITSAAKVSPFTTSAEKTQPVTKSLPASISAKIPPIATSSVKGLPISTITAKSPTISTNTLRSATDSIKASSVAASGSKPSTAKGTTSTSKTGVTSPALSSTVVGAVTTTAATNILTSNSVASKKKPEAKSTELSTDNKSFKG